MNVALIYVPGPEPVCPIEDCGIKLRLVVRNGRVLVVGPCSHFLRIDAASGKLMAVFADDVGE